MSVVVLIPLMRSHLIAPLVQNIAETTESCKIVVMATGECADAARDLPVELLEDDGGTYPVRINRGFTHTTDPYVFLGADDLLFHAGWFDAAMRVMNDIDGVVAVTDLHNPAGTHFLVSRNYINELGGSVDEPGMVLHEGYAHTYCDDEIRSTAMARDRFGYAPESIVEHMHPGAGKAPSDAIYQMGEASMTQGLDVYRSRSHLWGS